MKKKMDIVYKLTTQDNKTRKGEYNECTWGPGVTHSGTGKGSLCGPGFIHAYLSPELAVLLNTIHANIPNPKLWKCETEIVKSDKDLKVGGVVLTTLKEIPMPVVTTEQRVIFAILCSREIFGGRCKQWDDWAKNYLDGKDRTANAANAAHSAAYYADATARAAAYYADATARATAYYADAAANTAHFAAYYADAAAHVATIDFNIVSIARQALTYK